MSASTVPAPTPTNKNPPAQSVNLGILYCFPDHTSERATWYMSSDTVSNAIEQECEKWDSMASPWKVGPGATDQYSFTINVPDPSAGGTSTNVHFVIRSSKNDGCPVLDIGGTDKSPLCKDIFANSIVNNCELRRHTWGHMLMDVKVTTIRTVSHSRSKVVASSAIA